MRFTAPFIFLAIITIVQYPFAQSIPASSSSPTSLTDVVPTCAIDCIDSFVSSNYQISACKNSLDLDCLCTHTTSSGFTIGEAALSCVFTSCSSTAYTATDTYNICSSFSSAIPATHATITATIIPDPQTSQPASTVSLGVLLSSPPHTVTTTMTAPTNTSQIIASESLSVHPPTSTPSSTVAPSTSMATSMSSSIFSSSSISSILLNASTTLAPTAQPDAQSTVSADPTHTARESKISLSTGEIVGITAGGGVSVLLALGFLVFFCCIRKKKKERRRSQRWSAQIEKGPTTPFTPLPQGSNGGAPSANAQMVTPPGTQRYYAAAPTPTEDKRRSLWRRSIKPEDIGVAVSPEMLQRGSPASFSSQKTTSKLLPETPIHSLWPAPLKVNQRPQTSKEITWPESMRPESCSTEFEEDVVKGQRESSRTSQPFSTGSRPRLHALETRKVPPLKCRIPLTPVYDNGNPTPVCNNIDLQPTQMRHNDSRVRDLPPLPATYHPPALVPGGVNLHPFNNPMPRYDHSGVYSDSSLPPKESRTTLSERAPSSSNGPRKASSRYSAISDATSFEEDEDSTPEQESDKQIKPPDLSPVLESPLDSRADVAGEPSLKDLEYPRIPRPAAVSRQADRIPQPLALQPAVPDASRPPGSMDFQRRPSDDTIIQTNSSSSRDPSPASLLAKRRGDVAAGQMLQSGLKLTSTGGNKWPKSKWQIVHEEQWKVQHSTRPRSDSSGHHGSENVTPRSGGLPSGKTTITPTIRDGDLYLRVD